MNAVLETASPLQPRRHRINLPHGASFHRAGLRAKIAAVHVPGKPAHEARKETVALFATLWATPAGSPTKRSWPMAAVLLAPAVSLISKTI